MQAMLNLFDPSRRPGSYLRRGLLGDVLYSSYAHRDITLYFGALGGGVTRVQDALTDRMLQSGHITQAEKSACDLRIQAAFSTPEAVHGWDNASMEDLYRHIQHLRREALADKLDTWREAQIEYSDLLIDQSAQKNALLLQVSSVIFAVYDTAYLQHLRKDAENALRLGKAVYVLLGEDFVCENLLNDALNGLPAVFISDDTDFSDASALFAYGEEALLQCRSLRINAVIHARPTGFYARALIGSLDRIRSCIVYVPAHFDVTEYVPLRERTRLSYLQLWQLQKRFGDSIYTLSAEEMYRRYPEQFINMYQDAGLPLHLCMPRDKNAFAAHDLAREQAVSDYLNSFKNLTFSAHYFDETLSPAPLPYAAESPSKGILVHALRVTSARNAGVRSRDENRPLREMFAPEETGVFSNFLFFMTPKLSALYNELRRDRPPEQADVTAGHLDYKLCFEGNRRVETFPLFAKMCMAMKEDGTFLFCNFRLGGGSIRVGDHVFSWDRECVNAQNDAPVCVYTPYLSREDSDADRKTYRKTVGEGRVNLVILQDRIHCVRAGDVILPSAGVVVSLRADAAQSLLAHLTPLQDGYYDASALPFSVCLNAPEGVDPEAWRRVRWAYGGGLSLICEGKALCDESDLTAWFAKEGWTSPLSRQTQESDLHTLSRHPRTAIGCTKGGDMVLIVYSGRTRLSAGADYVEMCRIARQLCPDIHNLMNVDGGASAVMCIVKDGTVTELNCPSTSGQSCAGMARPIKTLLYIPAE
ncbi:MAG: phosphodiester glycosidase family protein [Clostridia bacterium]|nr:phosphodiester glycosidase family protein [Clostridia bacterium]